MELLGRRTELVPTLGPRALLCSPGYPTGPTSLIFRQACFSSRLARGALLASQHAHIRRSQAMN